MKIILNQVLEDKGISQNKMQRIAESSQPRFGT